MTTRHRRLLQSIGVGCRRTISSWTPVDISTRGDDKAITLYLQEQFTTPPGITKDSTGRRLWPTALPLLQWMIFRETISLSDTKPTVLELGAGCGLVGMGLAVSGGYGRVILTDASTEWLQRNVDRNGSQFLCPVDILPMQWGNRQDHDSLRTHLARNIPRTSSNQLPNNTRCQSEPSPGDMGLDYILGSDLLYNPTSQSDLVSTLIELASSRTRILLAYPKRADNEASFRKVAEYSGFTVQVLPLQGPNHHESQKFSLMTLVKHEGNYMLPVKDNRL